MEDRNKGHVLEGQAKVRWKPVPLASPREHEEVVVETERELLAMARPLAKRIKEDPQFSAMLLANPVLALKEYGIKLSPELQDHVLQALRHPKALRDRRAALEASLEETLGEKPRPNDGAWLAKLAFGTRKLQPRDTKGKSPALKTYDPDGFIERRKKARLPNTNRYPGERRIPVTTSIGLTPVMPSVRRLDLDAPLPELAYTDKAPDKLGLEEAWFYKDDPVVRDALELGIIEKRAFPFRIPDDFRKIQSAEKVDAFRAFVREVRIDPGKKR